MQTWAPSETEVEIIPPTFRKLIGRGSSSRRDLAGCRQSVNLTTVVPIAHERAGSSYDQTGRLVRQVLAGAAHFKVYA